ncbi:MAG: GAF domain-containing protein [Actinomycetota bacterium]|nr:GAF domain-containing protein [Actinomycetota bacterium]
MNQRRATQFCAEPYRRSPWTLRCPTRRPALRRTGYLHHPDTGTLHLTRQYGLTDQLATCYAAVRPGQPTACATAAATGRPVIIDEITRSPIFAGQPILDVMRDAGVRAVHSHPLRHDAGHLLGELSFHYRTTNLRRGDSELVAWCAARALTRTARP